ncbi:MAG: DEAD/DEAH box helicase [Opitutaceae bacterium]|jgi:SNF2 family DNA or RNA helicase|nr:DEAD/DEAH box helicase [Opitutaceae bacterium]
MLRLFLPPNLAAAAARDAIALKLELDAAGAPPAPLLPALALLQRWCGGTDAPPPFIQITRAQLRELIAALASQPVFFRLDQPSAPLSWAGPRLHGVSEHLREPPPPAPAGAVQRSAGGAPAGSGGAGASPVFSGGLAVHGRDARAPLPAAPFHSASRAPHSAARAPLSASAPAPMLVDGSEHYLAITLPSREHTAYAAARELLKNSGFRLEPSNRKWWLRDRRKTLAFLAAHGAALRDTFQAGFTENFEKNTARVSEAVIVCDTDEKTPAATAIAAVTPAATATTTPIPTAAAAASTAAAIGPIATGAATATAAGATTVGLIGPAGPAGGHRVTLGLRAGRVSENQLLAAVASGRGYVEDGDGGVYLLPPATLNRLAAAQRALAGGAGGAGEGLVVRRTHRVNAARLADAESVIEGIAPGFKPPAAWRELSAALRDTTRLVPAPVPAALDARLRPYQRLGAAWLWHLRRHGLGGILADEMGLGKTLQALAVIAALKNENTARPAAGAGPLGAPSFHSADGGNAAAPSTSAAPSASATASAPAALAAPSALAPAAPATALVVCPASLVENWRREAARFAPALRVFVHHGNSRLARASDLGAHDLVLTSYGTLARDRALFAAAPFALLIADEAQHLKNRRSQNAKTLRSLRAGSRFLLTGTPLENSLDDLRSLLEILLPGYLDAVPPGARGGERLWHDERLRARAAPYILRRTKASVAPELPAKIEQIIHCELTPAQAALYRRVRETAGRRLLDLEAAGASENAIRLATFTQLLRLRQICCDPRLVEPGKPDATGGKSQIPNPKSQKNSKSQKNPESQIQHPGSKTNSTAPDSPKDAADADVTADAAAAAAATTAAADDDDATADTVAAAAAATTVAAATAYTVAAAAVADTTADAADADADAAGQPFDSSAHRPFTAADSAKLDTFLELLDEAIDDGHRILVFSQFTKLLDLAAAELDARGIAHVRLDGSMGVRARQAAVDRFERDAAVPVFLISLKAGGTGLNLAAADTVIHLDPWWNPAVEAQATGRAHRIGQTRVVTSCKLICSGTVEEKVLQLQDAKRRLLADVFEAGDATAAKLSLADMKALLE